ncbi:odorant receptor 35a [Drosophila sulfurigaster albostrigata]|uniref:odorant receptor 35a n=1 Tax=Drosophila sulfurigaster albostrigata TaxID=89887 RepID=UPI002D21AE21|nr:odorant receptor 35a [Drosophila sulfurigaster albostrigata]
MARYTPLLADGQRVKLSWPLWLFRFNHIFWPLDERTSANGRRFDYFLAALAWAALMLHNDFELRYLLSQINNLDLLLAGVPTYLILVEGQLRSVHILMHREQLRKVLQNFFSSIYVEAKKEPLIYEGIQRKLRLNRVVCALYLATVSGYVLAPIMMLLRGRKDYLFSMIPAFDVNPLYIFVPFTLSSVYVALQIVTMVFGELALVCELMAHLNGRFRVIKRDLDAAIEKILEARQRPLMAQQMQEVLVQTMRQNVALNRFMAQMEQHFTVQIFILFAFSAILLCALGFKTYVSPSGTYIYPIWFGAKTVELLSLGQMGSDIAYMTNSQSSIYYLSQWEQVLYYSTNSRENLRLMKVITLAIELNYKPFYFTGLSYFYVSLQAVVKILQGAFSYFTFLSSIRLKQV